MPLMFENLREMWLQATRGARAGLVGVGPAPHQKAVLAVELEKGVNRRRVLDAVRARLKACPAAQGVNTVVRHRHIPVDRRHNSKVQREALAACYGRVAP